MNKKGLLILLIGPSGSGKGTVLKELLQADENTFLSISATTRKPRLGEEHGINYFFLDDAAFEDLKNRGGLLEHASYCGNSYGTPKQAVLERIDRGENVILEIEVQGAKQIKEMYDDALSIFILPPSLSELRRRLVDRKTEDDATVGARLETATEEIKYAYSCDYIVINDSISKAVSDIQAIMQATYCKASNMSGMLDKIISVEI